MSMQNQVNVLEQELFKALEYAFEYAAHRNYPKLKLVLEAIRQLEIDYKSMTKKNFIKQENIDRLQTTADKLKETLFEDQKALNVIIQKLK